jgi:hypothetical protein
LLGLNPVKIVKNRPKIVRKNVKMKFFYGLSVGVLLAGTTFAEECKTGYDAGAKKCVEGCLGPESCMDSATIQEYLDLKKPEDFPIQCNKSVACECNASKGYIQSNKTDKFSKCTPPSEKCIDTTEKYQKYECNENVCKCKKTDFDYCENPENECHKQGNTCKPVPFSETENFKDHKCGAAPKKNMILDIDSNEYVCKPGTTKNANKCQKIVNCESNNCNKNQKCLNVNDFQNICHSDQLSCNKPDSGRKEDVKCNCKSANSKMIGGYKKGCECIAEHIKIDGLCEKHDQFCSDSSCLATQSCTNGTMDTQLNCADYCPEVVEFYARQNQTCEGTTGKIGCVEGFEISSEEGAEASCTVRY